MKTNKTAHNLRKIISTFTILTLLLGGLAFPTTRVSAVGEITVNTDADNVTDDGLCTLREAITNANADAQTYDDCATGIGADTIFFAGNYTITLASAMPDITTEVIIEGNGAANTIVQASTCDPINQPGNCSTANWRVFYINSGSITTLKDLTVRYGKANGTEGAGIYNNNGSLTISNSRIMNNRALTGAFSSEGSFGGGIFTTGGTVSITDSSFSGNIAGNNESLSFPANGGGIYKAGGTLTISNSTFSGNSASAPVSPRNGGAIYNQSGTATISNSTFYGNAANGGYGGAIYNNSGLTLINSTLSNNQIGSGTGGALYNTVSGGLTLKNSILANSSGSGLDCVSNTSLASETNNLIETNGGCGNPASSADPMLGSLADNGGSTQTMSLLSGSPAIDVGDGTTCANAPANNLDQRGVTRPQGSQCDIGAFEVQVQTGPDFIVNSNADTDDGLCGILPDNDCTLREAINAANANADVSEITFAADYTITLVDQLPAITTEMGITGNGETNTVIQANASPDTANYRIFEVNAGNLTLSGMTLKNGRCNGSCATDSQNGGAILVVSGGALSLSNVTLSNNIADSKGGAVYTFGGSVEITDSTFIDNTASGTNSFGGAINLESGTPSTIANSAFANNSAKAGGAIATYVNLTISNSTFTGNTATQYSGGAIHIGFFGTLTLVNSTLSANTTPANYAALSNYGTLYLKNSILANTVNGVDCYNDSANGTVAGNTNSLIESNDGCGTPALTSDPKLGPLQDNGGPTQTMALLPGSDAIEAGDDATCAASPVNNLDQRGVTRPQGVHCDIGAFEFAPTFADVPISHWAWQYIESLYSASITGGCGAGNYCPDNQVTRAQMAVFLLRGIHGSGYTPPAATGTIFNDVGAGDFAAAWIEQMVSEGITSGCGGGNYCPNATVTRAQMAVFLLRAKYGSGYTPPAATGTIFNDVPSNGFAAAWIEQLVSESVTSGCGGGNYCPNAPVTRAQMAVFLVRIFNLP